MFYVVMNMVLCWLVIFNIDSTTAFMYRSLQYQCGEMEDSCFSPIPFSRHLDGECDVFIEGGKETPVCVATFWNLCKVYKRKVNSCKLSSSNFGQNCSFVAPIPGRCVYEEGDKARKCTIAERINLPYHPHCRRVETREVSDKQQLTKTNPNHKYVSTTSSSTNFFLSMLVLFCLLVIIFVAIALLV